LNSRVEVGGIAYFLSWRCVCSDAETSIQLPFVDNLFLLANLMPRQEIVLSMWLFQRWCMGGYSNKFHFCRPLLDRCWIQLLYTQQSSKNDRKLMSFTKDSLPNRYN